MNTGKRTTVRKTKPRRVEWRYISKEYSQLHLFVYVYGYVKARPSRRMITHTLYLLCTWCSRFTARKRVVRTCDLLTSTLFFFWVSLCMTSGRKITRTNIPSGTTAFRWSILLQLVCPLTLHPTCSLSTSWIGKLLLSSPSDGKYDNNNKMCSSMSFIIDHS